MIYYCSTNLKLHSSHFKYQLIKKETLLFRCHENVKSKTKEIPEPIWYC